MAEARTWWETIKGESGELVERVKSLIHEGNVRRIIIRQGDRSIAEFPLTVGVVGTVGAPILAVGGRDRRAGRELQHRRRAGNRRHVIPHPLNRRRRPTRRRLSRESPTGRPDRADARDVTS